MRTLVIQSPFGAAGPTDEFEYTGVLYSGAFESTLKKNNIISLEDSIYSFEVTPVIPKIGGVVLVETYDKPLQTFKIIEMLYYG